MAGITYTGFESNKAFRLCAEYVDRRSSVGNNDGSLGGKEEENLFKKIIKARYDFDYDFNKDMQTQANQIAEKDCRDGADFFDSQNSLSTESNIRSRLSIIGDNCGYAAGQQFATDLIGYTTGDDFTNIDKTLDRLLEDYTPEINNKLTVNFLKGYYKSAFEFSLNHPRSWFNWQNSGMFEQLGSENDSSKITNDQASKLMKKIMDAVPEEKQNSKDYETLKSAYEEYSSKTGNEKFKDNSGIMSRVFGTGYLDNLDDAIERLFDL